MSFNNNDQHHFAFYCPETSKYGAQFSVGTTCILGDRALCHRIMHVLRLKQGELFTLFDAHKHMECMLESINERSLHARIQSFECNMMFAPHISFLLPLLKKEAFEEALYTLTELGVNNIQLVTTKKTQRTWGGDKEKERIERMIQAAAEQSKNFAIPIVSDPVALESAVQKIHADAIKIFFDPEGCKIQNVVSSVSHSREPSLFLLVGPEGDLTKDEKAELERLGFFFCQLTPTILRAQQAVAVSVGALRSLMRL
jgi:16S rRNA (uracil1498-N3)-methyltransferase